MLLFIYIYLNYTYNYVSFTQVFSQVDLHPNKIIRTAKVFMQVFVEVLKKKFLGLCRLE